MTQEEFLTESLERTPPVVLVKLSTRQILDPARLLALAREHGRAAEEVRHDGDDRWHLKGHGWVQRVAPVVLALAPGDRRHYAGTRDMSRAIAKADPRMQPFRWGREYYLVCPPVTPPDIEPPTVMTLSFWLFQRASFFNGVALNGKVARAEPPEGEGSPHGPRRDADATAG